MGVSFTNNWEIILNKLESIFRTEFGKTLNVYTGIKNDFKGNQYLRISPSSSTFTNYSSHLEYREFGINLTLHFKSPNSKESSNDQVMRLISRIESLIVDNSAMTLSDNSIAYNCRIDSTEINTESENEYIVLFDFKCVHANSSLTPTVTITAAEVADGATSSDSALSLTFTLNRDSDNFVVGDVDVTNGSLSSFSGSGSVYTATFTPSTQGATTIKVLADKFTGIGASGGNTASDIFNWTYVPKFVFTVEIPSDDKTFALPIVEVAGHTPSFNIDWGDSSNDDITAHDDSALDHTYSTAGTKTITIDGTVKGLKFIGGGDKDLMRTISNWGGLDITEQLTFKGCTYLNVSASNAPTVTSTNLNSTFMDCPALTAIGTGWNVSSVTNMQNMFHGCTNFNGSDLVNWNTASLTNMNGLFEDASSFNQDIGSWDVADVTNMAEVFYKASSFNQDISSWNVSNATSMYRMFTSAIAFNNGGSDNIKNWDTSSVTNMESMFREASSFNQPLPTDGNKWNVSSVTTFKSMFQLASVFNQDISSWNVSSSESFYQMFYNADAFNQDLSNWTFTTGSDIDAFGMFRAMNVFNSPLNWGSKTARFTRTAGMFWYTENFNQDIDGWDTSNVTDMNSMFRDATAFNQSLNSWNVSSVENFSYMFNNASSFNQPLNDWDFKTSGDIDMRAMFRGAVGFNSSLAWCDGAGRANNTARVTTMWYMFDLGGSDVFTGIGLNNWDTSNVTDMTNMFSYTDAFNADISNWNTSSVTNMSAMFSHATAFNQNINSQGKNASNLKGWWRLNNSLEDEKGYNNATNSGASAVSGSGNTVGSLNTHSYDFESTESDYMNLGDHEFATTEGSMSAWVKIESDTDDIQSILAKYDTPSDRSYQIGINADLKPFCNAMDTAISFDSNTAITSSDALSTGTWYHIVGTFSTSDTHKVKIYVNGVLKGTSANSLDSGIQDTSQPIYIGRDGDGNYFDGLIQNVAIWDTVLTAEDVEDLYNSLAPTDLQEPASYDTPNAKWSVSKVTNMTSMFEDADAFDQSLSEWNFDDITGSSTGFNNFMKDKISSDKYSTANYNALLVQIEQTNEETDLQLHAGGASGAEPTGAGDTARAALITRGWTITDADS